MSDTFDFFPEREPQRLAVDVKPHRWEYCVNCQTFMVICAHCGNNGCNGGSGENCPDLCADAHAAQSRAFAAIRSLDEALEQRRAERAQERCLTNAPLS